LRLTVVGSINLDLVATAPRLPRAGETVTGATLARHPGGKGANQALAARRLGAEVDLIGAVGWDPMADEALLLVKAYGVGLEQILIEDDEPTGVALIAVDPEGENQIVVAAAGRGTDFVCINLAPAAPVSDQLLRRADLLVVNETEAEFYGDLLHQGGGRVVITLGARGAVMYQRGAEIARATPPKVKAVDATGAGDCFVGAICVALLEGMEPEAALRFACAAGAIAATRPGAQPSLPTRAEVEEILA
jgi:ribokinase